MAIDIKLPEVGDGVESGDVLEVLVKVGDMVKKDQGIIEIETGKATLQVPSSHAGKVAKVHVAAGQSVPVGGTLITLEESAGAAAPTPAAQPAAPAAQQPAAPAPVAEKPVAPQQPAQPAAQQPVAPQPAAQQPPPRPQPAPAAPAKAPPAQPVAPIAAEEIDDEGDVAAGPAVRRFAREVGIDLAAVHGSGPSGRVTREDVLEAVRSANQMARGATATAASPAVPAAPANSGAPAAGKAAAGETGTDNFGPVRIEKMTKIRKTIAERMHQSWSTIPRVTNFDDADVTQLESVRQHSKRDYEVTGVKLTTMPFLIKAVAMSLKQHPAINATIDVANDRIIYKQYVNVGIAVDTDRGLVVPVLRNADQMSIPQIARALSSMADNARAGHFSNADLQGGTFTISNLGAVGGTYSTPIINLPEVAILLVGRSRKMPVVLENDKIEVRLMMPLSISYDHRLVDGATAARFLNDVIGYLETPSRMLLAP